MTLLAALQDRFQHGLLAGDDCILSDVTDSPRETREVLFGVYRNAYPARLVEIIRSDYEKLSARLGEAPFDAMARAYIAAHPSHHANARWYSRDLPDFLKADPRWHGMPELADLAALERALNDAFDAADTPILTLDALAAIPAEDWGALRFRPHASVTRLDLRTNAAAIWIALKEDREPPAAMVCRSPVRLLVWRQEMLPKFREIPDDEAMIWDEAVAGVPFGVLCEMLSFRSESDDAPLRAAAMLQGWIAGGLVSEAA